ncbi:MAG TPA: isoprenylcysteine carboxylmethyltransferase family protein [Anaerolineaceae bacterium]|nr:isoprenylcysteine carboxylmethyltransferase family protein [Anaerolineaceae bacterium]HPN52869.1 isoprenylcysteine carboxylmethyltransferase family protein [Anaerolineaceae bacterium]
MATSNGAPGKPMKHVGLRMVLSFLLVASLPALILFTSSGRLDWWEAWVMVGVMAVTTGASRALIMKKQPDLVTERASWTKASGAKAWDLKLMPFVAIYGPVLFWLGAGLDKRWNATPALPAWLEGAAFLIILAGYAFSTWAFLENRFFAAVVRIQTDRGQVVVQSGPYHFVRHPGYAGAVLGYLLTPVALGALWAYVPGILLIGAVVLRTALEDRTLMAELPGYQEYAQKTKWRLLPGVW